MQAPRGVKRNLLRSYCAWEAQMEVPRPQFALAWFHAIVQERRTYIPQGWVKLYEFNDSDLSAALHILKSRIKKGNSSFTLLYLSYLFKLQTV